MSMGMSMRAPGLLLGLAVTTTLAACGEAGPAASFVIEKKGQGWIRTCADPLGVHALEDYESTITVEVENQGFDRGDIRSLQVEDITVESVQPRQQDFSYLDYMAFYVDAPGEPRVMVAEEHDFPDLGDHVDFQVKGVELRDYLTADYVRVTSEVRLHHCPPQDQLIEVTARFRVRATAGALEDLMNLAPGDVDIDRDDEY